jgi:hypothetical protein
MAMARAVEGNEKEEFASALKKLRSKVSELDLQLKEIKRELDSPPLCHRIPYLRSSRRPRQGRKL